MRAGEERERWESLPNVGVGPLRFGMSSAEVADALQVSGPQERAGGPYRREDFADGVATFYDAGKLACVALDALTGPQVYLAGFALGGPRPEQAHQYLLDYAAEHGNCLLYTPDDAGALGRRVKVTGVDFSSVRSRRSTCCGRWVMTRPGG
ncbi:hypothetical protein ACFXMT_32410 [Streptomyces mirabilis]|uniref:hypothetical protein n=1 Tax=Streptomyces mirabilis TaxID=68239 RepID=UPI003688C444